MKSFSFQPWAEDCSGITLQGTQKKGCSLFGSNKENVYRYAEQAVTRDAATRFYDNPSMLMIGVQRVAVVDENAGEVMICTPARAAAWMILRNRGRKDTVLAETNALDNILQSELDYVLKELHSRRNGSIKTDASENNDIPTKIIIKEGDGVGSGAAKTWECTGFADNGGWAKFFADVMTEGNRWMAVIEGQTSSPHERLQLEHGKFDLVFQDNECELLYGEGRRFTADNEVILGLQLRRGFCVLRPASGEESKLKYDQFVLPRGLSKGVYSQDSRELRSGLQWRILSDQALTHYTLGEENMQLGN